MLTPLPWRRPWKVASQVVTLDQISNGRTILAVGLGAVDNFLGSTGEELDRRKRAEMLDEGIDLIRGLWYGKLVHQGQHYQVDLAGRTDLVDIAQPVQNPIPIWVVGAWPSEKSMTRVLRCDGLLPNVKRGDQFAGAEAEDIPAILDWLRVRGGAGPGFDLVVEGETPSDDPMAAGAKIKPMADAGATWWLETRWALFNESEDRETVVRQRIEGGPPSIE